MGRLAEKARRRILYPVSIAILCFCSFTWAQAMVTGFSKPQAAAPLSGIIELDLSIMALNLSKVYDGTKTAPGRPPQLLSASFGVADGDNVTLIILDGEFETHRAGDGIPVAAPCSLGGRNAASYRIASPPKLSGRIFPKDLAASVREKEYDGTTAATVISMPEGVVGGDDVVLVATDAKFAAPNAGTGIPVSARLSLSGADASNYALASPTALTGTILPRSLAVVDVVIREKMYDGTVAAAVTAALDGDGIIGGDEVTLLIIGGEFAAPDAGMGIAVNARMELRGSSARNYSVVQPALTGNIAPKPLQFDGISILPIPAQLYTGLDVTPAVTVRDGSRTLVPSRDYTARYVDNVSIGGAASVTVAGAGNYTGEVSGTFEIMRGRGLRLFAGPSPARRTETMDFFWQGHYFETGTLLIYDYFGALVRTVDLRDQVLDHYGKRRVGAWDFRNSSGRLVSSGTYLVRGVFVTTQGKREDVALLVAVR